MGYSIGFLRGVLSLVAIIAACGLLIGSANELLELGLFTQGYPGLGGGRSGFGYFTIQMGGAIVVATAINLLLERIDR